MLTTLRPPTAGEHWLKVGAMLVALAVGLALPVLAVRITMSYWLWGVSVRRSLPGLMDTGGLRSGGVHTAPAAADDVLVRAGGSAP